MNNPIIQSLMPPRHLLNTVLLFVAGLLCNLSHAETVEGEVYAIKAEKAFVRVPSTMGIQPGDSVTFSVTVPGLDEVLEAGSGQVESVDQGAIVVNVTDGDVPLEALAVVKTGTKRVEKPANAKSKQQAQAPAAKQYQRQDYVLDDPTPVAQQCRHGGPYVNKFMAMHHPGYKRNIGKFTRWANKEIKRLKKGKENSPDFMYVALLGYWYWVGFDKDGIRVKPNPEKAFYYVEAAAAPKNAASALQFNLSQLYYDGIGVEQNKPLAAVWLKKAISDGHGEHVSALPLHNMGCLLLEGDAGMGIERDRAKALEFFRRGAELGWGRSIDMLQRLNR